MDRWLVWKPTDETSLCDPGDGLIAAEQAAMAPPFGDCGARSCVGSYARIRGVVMARRQLKAPAPGFRWPWREIPPGLDARIVAHHWQQRFRDRARLNQTAHRSVHVWLPQDRVASLRGDHRRPVPRSGWLADHGVASPESFVWRGTPVPPRQETKRAPRLPRAKDRNKPWMSVLES